MLKINLKNRRKRDRGGAWYDEERRAFPQPAGGIFDLVDLAGLLSCIYGLEILRRSAIITLAGAINILTSFAPQCRTNFRSWQSGSFPP